ncbi:MAG: hypothetical protein HYR52_06290, partial [Candidatus Tectomicrobia bacterium]|nr:hypothetical protein [Candidatus Tectomicrobia bacterium]
MKKTNHEPKVIFLFGAGASVEAGIPTSDRITNILLNYSHWSSSPESKHIENLLRYVQVKIADHLNTFASEINFEYILGALAELSSRSAFAVVPLLGEGDDLVRKIEARLPLRTVLAKLYSLLRELLSHIDSVEYLYPLSSFGNFSNLYRPRFVGHEVDGFPSLAACPSRPSFSARTWAGVRQPWRSMSQF